VLTHAEVGRYLLGIWACRSPTHRGRGQPPCAETRAIPGLSESLPRRTWRMSWVHDERDQPGSGPPSTGLDPSYLEYLGVTRQVDGWREMTRRHLETRPGLGRC